MADEPTTSELERLITRNHTETSNDIGDLKVQLTTQVAALFSRFNDHLLKAVYEANERARDVAALADRERIRRLEDERAEIRRGNRAALLAAVVAVAAAIATVVIDKLTKG